MKVLHIASFAGNIGDNANHQGMRAQFQHHFPGSHHFTEWEIRKSYRIYSGSDRWRFDDEFIAAANHHDLVIIGGGNFFEPWLEESATGTTIDLASSVLDQVRVPIVFYGVGFDTYKGRYPECLALFLGFLDDLSQRDKVWVSFRNDGSAENFQEAYGLAAPGVVTVPDGGFFFQSGLEPTLPFEPEARYWGINLAEDMLATRFPNGETDWHSFLVEFASLLQSALEADETLRLIFFPHIYTDLSAIAALLKQLDDRFCRNRVMVAPYLSGQQGAKQIFSNYKRCELLMGMRFHTNVCAQALNLPAIGLGTTAKLRDLYTRLGLEDRVVAINQAGASERLAKVIERFTHQKAELNAQNRKLGERLLWESNEFWSVVKQGIGE